MTAGCCALGINWNQSTPFVEVTNVIPEKKLLEAIIFFWSLIAELGQFSHKGFFRLIKEDMKKIKVDVCLLNPLVKCSEGTKESI